MNKLPKLALIGAAFTLSGNIAQAASVSATTDLEIRLPGVLILHYPSTVNVDLSSTDLLTFLNVANNPIDAGLKEVTGTLSGSDFTADVDIGTAVSGFNSSGTLTLTNAWAVRALANKAENVSVSIALNEPTLNYHDGDASSSIALSAPLVTYGTDTGGTVSFAAPGLGAASPAIGDVKFTIDLGNAKYAGLYTGGQYTLTAATP
jgi:hypothetical protein